MIFCINTIKSAKIESSHWDCGSVEVFTVDNKLVITTEPQTFCFGLLKDSDNNLKQEIYSEDTELLAQHRIKTKIRQLLSKYKHGNNIHEYQKQ